jgi:hypothetical protein
MVIELPIVPAVGEMPVITGRTTNPFGDGTVVPETVIVIDPVVTPAGAGTTIEIEFQLVGVA